jgi:hypothetical protein
MQGNNAIKKRGVFLINGGEQSKKNREQENGI